MLSFCLKCRKDRENTNRKVVMTKNKTILPFSNCAVCLSEKSRFIKE